MAQPIEGEVTFIYPELKAETRTARVRIEKMDDVLAADLEARRIAREEVTRLAAKALTVAVN